MQRLLILFLIFCSFESIAAEELKTICGRLDLVDKNLFVSEKPESPSRVTYLLMGNGLELLQPRIGVTIEVTGEVEMDSAHRGIITLHDYQILTLPDPKHDPSDQEKWVAFTAEKAGSKGVYLIKPDGTELKKVSMMNGEYSNLQWSLDGRALLFEYKNEAMEKTQLYQYSLDKDRAAPHNPNLAKPQLLWLDRGISPDGETRIISRPHGEKSRLVAINLLTGAEEHLTDGQSNDTHPKWSRDGQKILFLSDRTGQPQIQVMTWPGKKVETIKTAKPIADAIAWSKDQKKVYFLSDQSLHCQAIAGGQAEKLTESDYNCLELSVSP